MSEASSKRAISSALEEEVATVDCLDAFQRMGVFPAKIIRPVMDF
jgi:hypothetical protein